MTARVYVWVLSEELRSVGSVVARSWEDNGVAVEGPSVSDLSSVASAIEGAPGGLHLIVGGCGIDGDASAWLSARASAMLDSLPAVASFVWWREVGAVASRYVAAAGRVADALVVVMPGQLDLARSLTRDVLLGEAAHWLEALGLAETETTGPPADGASETRVPLSGWQAALTAQGGQSITGHPPQIPNDWASHAPLMDVLNRAGQRGSVALEDGVVWGMWGFPDLLRPSSKVLVVRDTREGPQLLALHRRPQAIGTVGDGAMGLSPCRGDALRELLDACGEGCPPLEGARMFAVERGEVWVETDTSVLKWDGRKLRDQGTAKQALATLALRWSSR